MMLSENISSALCGMTAYEEIELQKSPLTAIEINMLLDKRLCSLVVLDDKTVKMTKTDAGRIATSLLLGNERNKGTSDSEKASVDSVFEAPFSISIDDVDNHNEPQGQIYDLGDGPDIGWDDQLINEPPQADAPEEKLEQEEVEPQPTIIDHFERVFTVISAVDNAITQHEVNKKAREKLPPAFNNVSQIINIAELLFKDKRPQ